MTLKELVQSVELEEQIAFRKYLLTKKGCRQKGRADAIKRAENSFLEKKAVCVTIANHIGQDKYLQLIED